MEQIELNKENVINHWISTSEEDLETMTQLYQNKNYSWSLFLGHISTEKLLKAYYVKKHSSHAPFTHNLYRIAELSNLEISDEQADLLDKITTFNINARYDDYKREFYSLCTKEFTEEWIENIKKIQQWIKTML
jgi:HEPN domain-containing protein